MAGINTVLEGQDLYTEYSYQSKPPVKLVVCISPKRAYYWPASQDASNGPPIALLLQAAAKAACVFMPWYSYYL